MKKLHTIDKIIVVLILLLMIFVISCFQIPEQTNQDLKLREYPTHKMFLIEEAEASNMLNFNVEPPTENHWKLPYIPRMELVGNYNEYQKHWTQVAWRISGYDKEFMYMLKGENGLFNHDRQSLVYSNGVREPSYGFCQIHAGYHPKIVNDPRFFSDPEWQLQQCYRLWKEGTVFYGYNHREKSIPHFKFY